VPEEEHDDVGPAPWACSGRHRPRLPYAALLGGGGAALFCALAWDAPTLGWAAPARWWDLSGRAGPVVGPVGPAPGGPGAVALVMLAGGVGRERSPLVRRVLCQCQEGVRGREAAPGSGGDARAALGRASARLRARGSAVQGGLGPDPVPRLAACAVLASSRRRSWRAPLE
jgi:hypothetical protein